MGIHPNQPMSEVEKLCYVLQSSNEGIFANLDIFLWSLYLVYLVDKWSIG